MAEVVVVSCHQVDGVIPLYQDLGDKVLPGGGHHLLVKGDHQHLLNPEEPAQQIRPVLGRIDEGAGDAGDHLLGDAVKGEDRGDHAPVGGLLHGAPQQGGVAQMDSVKEAQGNDFFLCGHIVTLQKSS